MRPRARVQKLPQRGYEFRGVRHRARSAQGQPPAQRSACGACAPVP
ncbi:hypothetical protein DVR09_15680 (plasmid) [Erythrobacter aureus]|uniref:Uncharacterized protein n=1 Tax=Erythrobacter aureus TaxID=2182384 RepID=A0A345YIZ1_9SPHN|nr:hypothetical protein DVR09_15680 [Erythrobacter aureus]